MLARRFLVINLFSFRTPRFQAARQATECFQLIGSLGDCQVVDMVHIYDEPNSANFIGPVRAGKILDEIIAKNIDTVVVNDIVKPRQIFNLYMFWNRDKLRIEVWDRIDLILNIFEKHAHTKEAKVQIRLARIRHMGPSMYGVGKILSQQRGGIGVRGIGETNLELMKRHWRRELKIVTGELDKLQKIRFEQLRNRKQSGCKTISLVGYTNAGKTTLFNRLTKKSKFVKDYLFATLDSATGSLYLPGSKNAVIITDTIGFIENMPPEVIESFGSTLLETVHADLILHVIDMADEFIFEKIDAVDRILIDLGIDRKKKILVFNKSDLKRRGIKTKLTNIYQRNKLTFISAGNNIGIDILIRRINRILYKEKIKI